jgi:predicted secreted protein
MSWVSVFAIFFVVWWLTFFAVLPFGLKTQDEEHDVTLGTVPSAPRGSHVPRAMLRTTLIAAAICAGIYFGAQWLDLGMDDIPKIVPQFN